MHGGAMILLADSIKFNCFGFDLVFIYPCRVFLLKFDKIQIENKTPLIKLTLYMLKVDTFFKVTFDM